MRVELLVELAVLDGVLQQVVRLGHCRHRQLYAVFVLILASCLARRREQGGEECRTAKCARRPKARGSGCGLCGRAPSESASNQLVALLAAHGLYKTKEEARQG